MKTEKLADHWEKRRQTKEQAIRCDNCKNVVKHQANYYVLGGKTACCTGCCDALDKQPATPPPSDGRVTTYHPFDKGKK